MDIKQFIKVRKMKGLSQPQFARKAGYSHGYIAALEAGHRPFTKRLQRKFLDALGIDEEEAEVLASLYDTIRGDEAGGDSK